LSDTLLHQEIASKLIAANQHEDENGNPVNPIDANFRSLGLSSMEPIKRTSDEFSVLEAYVRDTHGHTHGHIKANVLNAFRVERYVFRSRCWLVVAHVIALTVPERPLRGRRAGLIKWRTGSVSCSGTDRGVPTLRVSSSKGCVLRRLKVSLPFCSRGTSLLTAV
jgi:hypothetical protein